jgi:AraC-like DNA-binding protein
MDVPEGQVRILESHHAVDFEMEIGAWGFHKICWVAMGRGVLETSSNLLRLKRNDFLLLPAHWTHRFVDDSKEPLTLVIVCISEKFIKAGADAQLNKLWEIALKQYPLGQPRTAKTAFHMNSLIESFRQGLREQEKQVLGWETALSLVGHHVLLNFARGYSEASELHKHSSLQTVRGAISYIDSHVHENLQIGDMAARCHLSPRRFTDLFKQETGQTFSHYLNRSRIEYACSRLNETGHIVYACHESGFNDLAYFYRVFKKAKGITPGQYLAEFHSEQPPSPLGSVKA